MDEMEAQEAAEMKRKIENPQDYELEKAMEQDIEELESILRS